MLKLFSVLRDAIGVQRILAGVLGFYCLFQVEVLDDTPFGHLFGFALLGVWTILMMSSGLFMIAEQRTARKQSLALALMFIGVFYLNHDADSTIMWVWPVPHDTSLDELLRWFILPLSFALLVLEIILPPWPFLKWRIWMEPSQQA